MFNSIGALRSIVFAFFTTVLLVGCGGGSKTSPTLPPAGSIGAPTGLQAVAGDASATLTWNAVTGATNYRVYRSMSAGGAYTQIASPTGTSYSDSGLTGGSTYYYVVRAYNGTTESVNSTEVSVTPTLAAPTDLQAVAGNASATLTWNAVTGATSYRVYRSVSAGGPYTQIASPTGTSYNDSGLVNSATYYYVVRASSGDTESANSNEVSVTPNALLPAAPTGVGASVSNTDVTLNWSAVSGASGYRIYRATTSGGAYSLAGSNTNPTYTDSGLSRGTTYYYVIRSFTTDGESTNSQEVSASIALLPVPTGVSASALNATITINWSAVSGASEYRVYRATASGGTYALAGSTASLTYTDTGLADGTTYYYVVRALVQGEESTNSQEVSATINRLPAPTGVAVAPGNGVLSVSWQPVTGATQYTLFRGTTSGGPYAQVATSANTSYLNSGLTNNTTYYYVVRANSGAEESVNSSQGFGTPRNLAPPPPVTPPSTEFSSLAGWTTYDGYALRSPGDTPNFANITSTGSRLSIQIPGGAEHNMWLLRHAAALTSYVGTGIYETKVDSNLTGNQQFGLTFRQDENTFLVFMVYVDPDDTVQAYVERFINVAPDDSSSTGKTTFPGPGTGVPLGLSQPTNGPFYLRVAVTDDGAPGDRSWTFSWSPDGIDWTTLINQTLEDSTDNIGTIGEVGVFAGNQPDVPPASFDAFTALFDYFHYYPDEASMPAPAPESFTARGGDNQVELWWDAVASVAGYSVYSASTPAGPFTLLQDTTATTITDSSASNGSPRSYLVRARRGGFEGGDSQIVTATAHTLSEFAAVPTTGLLVALSASELTTLGLSGGDTVTQWPNVLGPQIAARGVLDAAPTFIASGINGKPVVRFDGVDNFLQLPAGFNDFTAGVSIYVVINPSGTPSGFKVVALGNALGDDKNTVLFGRAGASAGLQYATSDSSSTFGFIESSDGFQVGQATTLSVLQDAGTAGSSVAAQMSQDGTPLVVTGGTTTVLVPPVTTRNANYIGKSLFPADGLFDGDIAEIFIYNRKLTPAEDVAIRGYLSAKYSLP